MDNGAFAAWSNGKEWDECSFEKGVSWAEKQHLQPRWVVVPDVVTNADATIEKWHTWAPILRGRGFRVALAVQDGMENDDAARLNPDVIFIGGSKPWKMKTISRWCDSFPRVHVGRINGLNGLMACHKAGAESVDGTGFFRGRRAQLAELIEYIDAFGDRATHPMFLDREHTDQALLFND
jgi:hypothetical protein